MMRTSRPRFCGLPGPSKKLVRRVDVSCSRRCVACGSCAQEDDEQRGEKSRGSGSDSKAGRNAWNVCNSTERFQIATVSVGSAVINLGFGIVIPALPSLSMQFGFGASGVGLLLAAPAVARIIANLPAGALSDSIGRVKCMAAGTALAAAGTLGTGLVSSLPALIAVRFAQGVGSATAGTSSTAYTAELTERPHIRPYRGVILGIQGGLVGIGYSLGPGFGGLLTDSFGPQVAFCSVAAITAACAAMYSRLPEERRFPQAGFQSQLATDTKGSVVEGLKSSVSLMGDAAKTWRTLLQDPNQQGLLLGTGTLYLNYAAAITVLPMQVADTVGATAGEIGILFSGSAMIAVVLSPFAGRCVDKFGRLPTVLPSSAMMSIGCAGLALATDWTQFVAAISAWSLGQAFLSTSIQAYAADIAPKDQTGSALSLSRQSQDIVLAVAPLLLGVVYDLCPGPTAFLCTSIATALGGAIFRVRAREVLEHAAKNIIGRAK